jgi:hypothetical protein
MRHLSSATLAAVVTVLLLAPPATASWGENGKCQREAEPVNRHCYFLADWAGQERWGAIDYVSIKRATVPGWAAGDFDSMEMWIFFDRRAGEWIETGSIVGYWSGSEHNWTRFNARKSALDGFNLFRESQTQTTAHYATYGLMDLSEFEAWDVLYEGLGYSCGTWCKVNRYGSWPFRFNEAEAGMEVGSETEPTVEAADSTGAVNEQASGIYAGGRYIFGAEGPFDAWCGALEWQTDGNLIGKANPDVGNYQHCGGAYKVGDLNVLVNGGAPASPALKAAKLNEAVALGKPADATVSHEGSLEVLESKAHKFHPNVPVPRGQTGPTGKDEVLRRGLGGRVQALWVGEGKPDGQARKLLEPQPEVGAPSGGSGPIAGEAGICYGC